MSAVDIKQEFRFTVLGAAGVGKTSLLLRLAGKPFNRKAGHRPSLEDEAVQHSLQVATSAGLLLFHFYDWAWAEKRKDEDISRHLAKGSDGAVFVYDVTEKRSKVDFYDFNDWYERAAGFDKPWIIISNKNEQKKHSVLEGEGQALASKGNTLWPSYSYVCEKVYNFLAFESDTVAHLIGVYFVRKSEMLCASEFGR
jgi:GTPase SAR1 family protein